MTYLPPKSILPEDPDSSNDGGADQALRSINEALGVLEGNVDSNSFAFRLLNSGRKAIETVRDHEFAITPELLDADSSAHRDLTHNSEARQYHLTRLALLILLDEEPAPAWLLGPDRSREVVDLLDARTVRVYDRLFSAWTDVDGLFLNVLEDVVPRMLPGYRSLVALAGRREWTWRDEAREWEEFPDVPDALYDALEAAGHRRPDYWAEVAERARYFGNHAADYDRFRWLKNKAFCNVMNTELDGRETIEPGNRDTYDYPPDEGPDEGTAGSGDGAPPA